MPGRYPAKAALGEEDIAADGSAPAARNEKSDPIPTTSHLASRRLVQTLQGSPPGDEGS
jgi:hypothetical protein